MTDIYSKVKVLDVKPIVYHYMDQLCLGELFEKYIPKTDKMELAPAEVLKMMVFNIINSPSPLRYGHNKDGHPDCLQLVYGLNITEDGNVPLSFELFNGNQSDDTTHVPNWEQLREMLGKTDFVYVADCKLCSSENLDHINQNKGKFITVVPKREKWLS